MEKNEKTSGGVAKTYADDMAKVLEEDQSGGLIKKILHSKEESDAEKKNLSPESAKNKFFMFASFILILTGMVAISFLVFKKNISTVTLEQQFKPLIFTDKSAFLPAKGLSKDEIFRTIQNEVSTSTIKQGGVEGIYLTSDKGVLGLRYFINLISPNFIPGDPNYIYDNFLIGFVDNETKDPFILIKVRSLPDVFGSFHAWEPKMFFDLHDFFGTALSSETQGLLTKDFVDGVIENKNARILYTTDTGGSSKIAMAYIFADDNSVLITNTSNAAREIIMRLASSQVAK